MMSGLLAVSYFLFALFFSLLSFVLWTRIALRYVRMSTLHPISQTVYKLSNPLVMPLSEHFINPKARLSRYDWPCFCILILVELLKFVAIGSLFLGARFPFIYLPIYILADLIVQPCNLLFYALIIRILMSWINPHWHHPIADVIRRITDPLLRLGHRVAPNMAGIDFSPFVVMIVLKVIVLFIEASLPLPLL